MEMEEFNMTGPEMLRKWLTGMGYTDGLLEFVKQFPEAKYNGTIYRGMFFDHYPSMSEIYDSDFCSWTTSKDVANYFASHTKYGLVLTKKSTGYDVCKIIKVLVERGDLPESMLNYRKNASEFEILDGFVADLVNVRRVGVY